MNADEVRNISAHSSAQEDLDMPGTEKQKAAAEAGGQAVAQPADQSERMIQNILKQISESVQRRVNITTLQIERRRRRLSFLGWDHYPCLPPEIQRVCNYFRDLGYRIEITKHWYQNSDIRSVYICW